MQRLLLFSMSWFVLAISIAHGVPARPLYEPETPPKAPPPPVEADLRGTAWLGKYNAIQRIFIFEADGSLSYKSSTATSAIFKQRGKWWLDGTTLYFEHNVGAKKVMDFRVIVMDGATIVGESILTTGGAKSQQTLKRTTVPLKIPLK